MYSFLYFDNQLLYPWGCGFFGSRVGLSGEGRVIFWDVKRVIPALDVLVEISSSDLDIDGIGSSLVDQHLLNSLRDFVRVVCDSYRVKSCLARLVIWRRGATHHQSKYRG